MKFPKAYNLKDVQRASNKVRSHIDYHFLYRIEESEETRRGGDGTEYVETVYRGDLVFTNGFFLIILPVLPEEGDVPGMISIDALEQASKISPSEMVSVLVGEENLMFEHKDLPGSTVTAPRFAKEHPGEYPDIMMVIPTRQQMNATISGANAPCIGAGYMMTVLNIFGSFSKNDARIAAQEVGLDLSETDWRPQFAYIPIGLEEPVLLAQEAYLMHGGWRPGIGDAIAVLMPVICKRGK